MKDYGLQVLAGGIAYHSDRRKRDRQTRELLQEPPARRWYRGERGEVSELSRASQQRLEFIAANVDVVLNTLITLTYHAPGATWGDPERNARIAKCSKRDLNRFLSCLRHELGAYLWVQEFQKRGAVHFHVACEGVVSDERVKVAWSRATGETGGAALLHAAKAEAIRGEVGTRSYVGRYVGKERQKRLPPGVEKAGRWWGRSQSMRLAVRCEAVTAREGDVELDPVAVRVVRGMRAFLTKRLGWKFRGGSFVNWGGALCGEALRVMEGLTAFYAGERP